MSAGGGQTGVWFGTVIVEEASEPKIYLGVRQDRDNEEDLDRLDIELGLGDVGFNVHALDPDLAALLSSNKIAGENGSRSGSTEKLPPSTSLTMRIRRVNDEGNPPSSLSSASSQSNGPAPPPLPAESPQFSVQTISQVTLTNQHPSAIPFLRFNSIFPFVDAVAFPSL